jgi:hypothetical protein
MISAMPSDITARRAGTDSPRSRNVAEPRKGHHPKLARNRSRGAPDLSARVSQARLRNRERFTKTPVRGGCRVFARGTKHAAAARPVRPRPLRRLPRANITVTSPHCGRGVACLCRVLVGFCVAPAAATSTCGYTAASLRCGRGIARLCRVLAGSCVALAADISTCGYTAASLTIGAIEYPPGCALGCSGPQLGAARDCV